MTRKKNKYKEDTFTYSDESSSESDAEEFNMHLYESNVFDRIYPIYCEISTSILFPYRWNYGTFCKFIDDVRFGNCRSETLNSKWIDDIGEEQLFYYVNMLCGIIMTVHKEDNNVYKGIRLHYEVVQKNIINFLYKMSIMV